MKPNYFRWEYKAPSENEIISDGEFLYLYDPDLKQVIVSKLDKQVGISPAMLLVSDNIHEFFNTKLISNLFQKHLDFCSNNVYNEYTNCENN